LGVLVKRQSRNRLSTKGLGRDWDACSGTSEKISI